MLGPIVLDIKGCTLDDDDRRRILHPYVGMVILFTRNYENPTQLKVLCDEIHALKPGIMIAVDHEGGRVQRFREGLRPVRRCARSVNCGSMIRKMPFVVPSRRAM